MGGLLLLGFFCLILGPISVILALVAISSSSHLARDMARLQRQFEELAERLRLFEGRAPSSALVEAAPPIDPPGRLEQPAATQMPAKADVATSPAKVEPPAAMEARPQVEKGPAATSDDVVGEPVRQPPSSQTTASPMTPRRRSFEEKLGAHWSVWIGGVALALGVVLLVRFSIEHDFFGPG